MIPADDEHTSPNSTEKSTSTRNSLEKSELWKHHTEDNDEPSPLQPLPPCLMKWKAPIWIAVAGFFIALPFAIIWRGTPHWPSAEAMKLCATIAGAGFAFSAWQQRSHDNAIREEERTKAQQQFEQDLREREQQRIEKREQYEKEREQREQQIRLEQRRYEADRRHSEQKIRREQRRYEARRAEREQDRLDKQHQFDVEREERERNRLEQIERDEYWKRREHILHTLDSNNPGIRLAAISLLAELADSAAHSNLLNPAAQQQLQQHIISTLCLQLRHEGQLLEWEGTKEEHIGIQSEILEVIFTRVDPADKKDLLANWSMEVLNFRNVNFHTEFKMTNRKTQCTIELTGAVFHENATFSGCTINKIVWHESSFMKRLEFHAQRKDNRPGTIVSHDNFPKYISYGEFKGIAFCKEESMEGLDHRINIRASNKSNSPNYDDINYLNFSECTFLHTISTSHKASNRPVAYQRTKGKSILDKTQLPENYTWGILRIEQINYDSTPTHERDTDLKFDRCTFGKVTIDSGLTHSNTEFTSCYFTSLVYITITTANRSFAFEDKDHIIFNHCIFAISSNMNTPFKLRYITHRKGAYIPHTFLQLQENQAQTYAENGQPIFEKLELTGNSIGKRRLRIMPRAELLSFEEIVTHS